MKPLNSYFLLLTVGVLSINSVIVSAKTYQVSSPDNNITISVNTDKGITYSAKVANDVLLAESKIDITIEGQQSFTTSQVVDETRTTINRVLTPHVQQKSKEVTEHYNELTLLMASTQINMPVIIKCLPYK